MQSLIRWLPCCVLVAVAALCIASAAVAQEQPAPGAAQPAETAPQAPEPAAPERPFTVGVLTGDNVNVRQGAGTEYPIYYKAAMGTEVKVVGRQGQWLEVEFPAKGFSWVSKDYLSKFDETTGIVTGNEVNVRGGPGLQFDELYRVQANHKFKIQGVDITGNWYRVSPMPGATAWVISDYVRLSGPLPGEGPTPPPTAPVPPPTTTAPPGATVTPQPPQPAPEPGVYEAKMQEADDALKAEFSKEDPAEWDIDKLREMFKEIDEKSDDAVLRLQARAKLAQLNAYEAIKIRAIEIGKVDEELQARLRELEKARQEVAPPSSRAASAYLATGKLDKFYITGYGGATHKLTDPDGSIIFLLKSEVAGLENYEGKICGIKGQVISVPGVKVQIVEVTEAAAFQAGA